MLSGDEIRRAGIVRLGDSAWESAHVQPGGVDLSLAGVWRFEEVGSLGVSDDDRRLPAHADLAFDKWGWIELPPGCYGIGYAEWVELPLDCGGLCFPRSSLLRMGAQVPTAVWDAGYGGRGRGLLVVNNPRGLRLQRGARVAQLVVFRLSEAAVAGYVGRYQHEDSQTH